MKRLFRMISAALPLALAACSPQPRSIPYDLPDGEVRLISFNIRQSGLAEKDGPDRWQKRREATLNLFERETPSVLGIQEGLIDQVRYIERNCPQYARLGAGRDDGEEGGEIMAIFYRADRFDAIDHGTFWLSETPREVSRGWDAACNRTVTWVRLREKATGGEFYYLNTHFDHQGEEARRRSAQLVADYVRDSIPAGAVVIVGGDLNSGIDDPIFDPLKAVLAVGRDVADPTDRGGTFNAFGAAPGTIVIDHIFCRGALDPQLSTLRGDYGAPFISDHYPVLFTFRLPAGGSDARSAADSDAAEAAAPAKESL